MFCPRCHGYRDDPSFSRCTDCIAVEEMEKALLDEQFPIKIIDVDSTGASRKFKFTFRSEEPLTFISHSIQYSPGSPVVTKEVTDMKFDELKMEEK